MGPVDPDPDAPDGRACRAARVLVVAERGIWMSLREIRAYGRFATWDDGSPVYDAAGWPQPSPAMLDQGITSDDLRPVGPCAPNDEWG